MHTLGKVFNWCVVVLALGAMYLTAKALDIRQSWLKKVVTEDAKLAEFQDSEKGLPKLRAKLAALQADYDRQMLGWGQYWDNIIAEGSTEDGRITLGIGRGDLNDKDPLDNPVTPSVFAFQPLEGGGYEYVGEFKAIRLDVGQSTFKANWRVRPGESKGWKAGNNWRLRQLIPDGEKARFTDLEAQLLVEDEFLDATRNDLRRQTELLGFADDHLALRVGEIEGFSDFDEEQQKKLPKDLVQGVLKSLSEEEELRNAAVEEADGLRRALQKTRQAIETTTAKNARMVESLKRQSTSEPLSANLSVPKP